jgi:single-strand DNA-binding protein
VPRCAPSRSRPTGTKVSFFEVTTWSRLAEVCGESLLKGRGVRVVGRLKQDRWTSPEGQARSKVSIVAEHVEFKPQLKGKDGDGKDDSAAAEGKAEEKATEEQTQDESELKEAAGF